MILMQALIPPLQMWTSTRAFVQEVDIHKSIAFRLKKWVQNITFFVIFPQELTF